MPGTRSFIAPTLVNPRIINSDNHGNPAVTITTAGAATYTVTQLLGLMISRDCNGAGRTDTTPTAANIIAGGGLQLDGTSFSTYLKNTSDAAETITLSAGAGVTLLGGDYTIAQSKQARLTWIRTSSTTVDCLVEIFAA